MSESLRCKVHGDKTWVLICGGLTAWLEAELAEAKVKGRQGALTGVVVENDCAASRRQLKRTRTLNALDDAADGGEEARKKARAAAASRASEEDTGEDVERQLAALMDGDACSKEGEEKRAAQVVDLDELAIELPATATEPPGRAAAQEVAQGSATEPPGQRTEGASEEDPSDDA